MSSDRRPGLSSGSRSRMARSNTGKTAGSTRGQTRGGTNDGYIALPSGGRKFVGGAAIARRTARSQATRIMRPDEKQRVTLVIPMTLNPFERFFAGLLRSNAKDFLPSQTKQLETWRTICQRLKLPVPEGPLRPIYPDGKHHFFYRAALVMEEARHAIADGITRYHRRTSQGANQPLDTNMNNKRNNRHQRQNQASKDTLCVTLTSVEQRDKSGHTIFHFSHDKAFTPEQILALRQGTVVACVNRKLASSVANAILGCILPASREEMIKELRFTVMIFNTNKAVPQTKWELTPVAGLISEQRKFEACTSKSTINIPFLHPLLGGKFRSTHTRFTEDQQGNTVGVVENDDDGDEEFRESVEEEGSTLVPLHVVRDTFSIPPLNRTQEKAARSFLASDPNMITLIQGPPGTGKTTLLVSIICRYVLESISHGMSRSLMVCAPTNKAVSVLCNRFLESIRDKDQLPCNVLLVGDDDKLLDDDYSRNNRHGGGASRLRSIFLYTWIQTVGEDYDRIRYHLTTRNRGQHSNCGNNNGYWAYKLSQRLEARLKRSLSLPKTLQDEMSELTAWLEKNACSSNGSGESPRRAISAVQEILQAIREWRSDQIWQQLLGSAHIIFCTLASAGATILKKSIVEINDLIVDEAAASTEPEMYIPFQFRPERLLAVGDPKQLPATVFSRVAEERGLSRSLHERLMYDCKFKHIMLDTQYRMRPDLSRFPSQTFYGGNLRNGSNVSSREYGSPVQLVGGWPYRFLQVNGSERQASTGSFENQDEAHVVVNLVQELQAASRRAPGKWHSPDRIRIITFYQAQVSLIKRLLYKRRCRDVVVATVDSSQGCEADIVIVSFVRSHSAYGGRNSVGFLSDDRRLNVAITRAKYQLICVGNAKRMLSLSNANAKTIKNLAVDAFDRDCIVPRPSVHNGDRNVKRLSELDIQDSEHSKRRRVTPLPDDIGSQNRYPDPGNRAENGQIEAETVTRSQYERSTFRSTGNTSPSTLKTEPKEEKSEPQRPASRDRKDAPRGVPSRDRRESQERISLKGESETIIQQPGRGINENPKLAATEREMVFATSRSSIKQESTGITTDSSANNRSDQSRYSREELLDFLDSDSSTTSSTSSSSSSSSSSSCSSTDDDEGEGIPTQMEQKVVIDSTSETKVPLRAEVEESSDEEILIIEPKKESTTCFQVKNEEDTGLDSRYDYIDV